ncbi:MAG: hypothetical protein WC600_15145 [Desulfobaccales bacterium]
MGAQEYTRNVFINCPFDKEYREIFYAILFAIFDCGYIPRCALELGDGGEVRIQEIARIISECKFGIHDISRTELDTISNLPRFNMPLELGLFMGAKKYGSKKDKSKICLILDREMYRYQAFISDISGQDVKSHNNDRYMVIPIIRDWLRNSSGRSTIPGGAAIRSRYQLFITELPDLCSVLKLEPDNLIFNDYALLVSEWLKQNP